MKKIVVVCLIMFAASGQLARAAELIGTLPYVWSAPPLQSGGTFFSPTSSILLHHESPGGGNACVIFGRDGADTTCVGHEQSVLGTCRVNGISIPYADHGQSVWPDGGGNHCNEWYLWENVTVNLGEPGTFTIQRIAENTQGIGVVGMGEWQIWTVGEIPPPFEILSATFDRDHYQNGVDTAHVTVVTRSNWGSEDNLLLSADITPSVGPLFHMGDDVFPLSPGEEKVSLFSWALPDSHFAWEFSGVVTLYDDSGMRSPPIGVYPIPGRFVASPVDEAVIEQFQNDLQECWFDLNSDCTVDLVDILVGISGIAHGARFIERMCEAGALRRAGHPQESWAVAKEGFLEFGQTAVTIYSGVFGEGYAFYEAADALTTVGHFASNCIDREFGGGGAGLREEVSAGELVDSLAVWIRAAGDSSSVPLADALLLEGRCHVVVEADSSWADRDSTGLNFVDFAEAESLGTATFVTKGVHRVTHEEGENPRSSARFTVTSQLDQVLNVGLLHRIEADSLVLVRYPEFTVTASSLVAVVVADSISVPVLEVDLDGDGTVDFLWYPGAAGIDNEPSQAAREGLALMLTSSPNPIVSSAVLFLHSAVDLKDVRVSVYDVAGREVRRLSVGDFGPGTHQVPWDGRDNDGRQVASGIYHCVATHSDGGRTAKRLVVLR
jgi:hypothetical protein